MDFEFVNFGSSVGFVFVKEIVKKCCCKILFGGRIKGDLLSLLFFDDFSVNRR